MACDWGAAEPGVGALCDSSPRATHHVVQETSELPTAAGESGSAERAC
jgi:hypothetical protein